MRSTLRLLHDEGLDHRAGLRTLTSRYGVPGLHDVFAAHDAVPPPASFSAPIVSGGAAALGGQMDVTVNSDGSVRWHGHAHDSGADGYEYSVTALVRPTTGMPIALVHHGHVGGTFTSGDRNDPWDELRPPGSVDRLHVRDFAAGTMETHLEYESAIGSAVESLFDWVVKFAVGALATPVGAILFVGLEIGSLASTGSLVPGARIAEGILWMAGPANTLFALGAAAIAAAGTNERELSVEEYDWANRPDLFAGVLPPRDRIRLTDMLGGDDRPFTFPRFDGKISVNLGPDAFADPRTYKVSTGSKAYGETFVHELVHACQIDREQNLTWLAGALSSKLESDAYDYPPASTDYLALNIEQQAQTISDWFAGRAGHNAAIGTAQPMDMANPYFRYVIENVRTGNFS